MRATTRTAAVVLLACAAPASADAQVVAVARDGGTLAVTNATAAPVRLNGAVVVEGLRGREWVPVTTEMALVAACPANAVAATPNPVLLRPGQTPTPPRWQGFSCQGQCNGHCRANIYWGAGPFRFRVTSTTGATFTSNSFRMPPQPMR